MSDSAETLHGPQNVDLLTADDDKDSGTTFTRVLCKRTHNYFVDVHL